MSAKKRTKAARGRTVSSSENGHRARTESARGDDATAPAEDEVDAAEASTRQEERSEAGDERAPRAGASSARTSPRTPTAGSGSSKKRKRDATPRPPQLESVFSPIEIDFFERAADMYADEYDVWEDFRRGELN